MRSLLVLLALLNPGLCFGTEPPSKDAPGAPGEVIAHVHFSGMDRLKAITGASAFKEIWQLPATAQLRAQILDKLASALAPGFQPANGQSTPAATALLRPLLDDLIERESYWEISRPDEKRTLGTLAIFVDPARSQLWETNCSQLLAGWKRSAGSRSNHVSYASSKSWFVVSCQSGSADGSENLAAKSPIFQRIISKGRPIDPPQDNLLSLHANFARLSAKWPMLAATNQPVIEFTVSGKGARLKSEARIVFPQSSAWRLEKWQLPADTIRDPEGKLISLIAVQGLAPWLNRQPALREWGLSPAPNQLFVWGDAHAPFQLHAAAPVRNASNFLHAFQARQLTNLNAKLSESDKGELQFLTNLSRLTWVGLAPGLFPYLRPAAEPEGEFLVAGIFPLNEAITNPPPAELLEQFTSRTNLLYYDWEITQARLVQLQALAPFVPLFLDVQNPGTNSTSSRWLEAIEPKLDNTVTEISVASPRELRFVRNSQAGFNGLELTALAYWFESTNFPRLNLRIPLQPPAKPGRRTANP